MCWWTSTARSERVGVKQYSRLNRQHNQWERQIEWLACQSLEQIPGKRCEYARQVFGLDRPTGINSKWAIDLVSWIHWLTSTNEWQTDLCTKRTCWAGEVEGWRAGGSCSAEIHCNRWKIGWRTFDLRYLSLGRWRKFRESVAETICFWSNEVVTWAI